jgi:hypothetical protein
MMTIICTTDEDTGILNKVITDNEIWCYYFQPHLNIKPNTGRHFGRDGGTERGCNKGAVCMLPALVHPLAEMCDVRRELF